MVAIAAAGCGGSADEASDAVGSDTSAGRVASEGDTTTTVVSESTAITAAPTTTVAEAVADAISIEPSVDVRVGAATAFSPVADPAPVAAGDTVRTDQTGFAEIAYFDGSLTRLDVGTEFEVLELVDDVAGSLVRTRMGVGRTWHRVKELGEGGEFSVETSVATAVVQGTAFSVDCPTEDACTFAVVEGALRIDLADGTAVDLVAPAGLTVDAAGAGAPVPISFDGAFGDEWLFENGGRDADASFPSPAEVFQAHGPAYGSISGTFAGQRTITTLECVAACENEPPIGDVDDRSYTFDIDCSAGVPCVGTIDTEFRNAGETTRDTTEVVFDGTSYRWQLAYSSPACFTDTDGDGEYDTETGNIDTVVSWVMTPTAAEIVDERWVVTAMSDLSVGGATNVVTDSGNCAGPEYYQGSSSKADIVVTRQP
jgi:hypothetical protein